MKWSQPDKHYIKSKCGYTITKAVMADFSDDNAETKTVYRCWHKGHDFGGVFSSAEIAMEACEAHAEAGDG